MGTRRAASWWMRRRSTQLPENAPCVPGAHKGRTRVGLSTARDSKCCRCPKDPSMLAATFPPFRVAEGQLDQDGFPISGAMLCLVVSKDGCYQMPSRTSGGSGRVTYDFGLAPHAKILPLTNGGSWAFFSAMFSAGGSGTLTRSAILRYSGGKDGALINLLPYVGVTNVSEHATWTSLVPRLIRC
jgi:hypothetical protein